MGKLTRIISPAYVSGFKCIGGECEDSCCIGWDIDIDKLTYRKYFRTKDAQMKQEFVKYVYKNEDCDSEDVDYGRVRIEESKWCPFLNESKLCRIYSNLGEDYLSNLCYSYPRVYNVLDGVYELSLYMSCPEAIRKMFESREPLKFVNNDILLNKHIIHSYIERGDSQWKNSPLKHLKELRTMSIEMIQSRNEPLGKRLLRLGYTLEKKKTSGKKCHTKVEETSLNHLFQLGFFRDIINSLNVFNDIDSPVFIELTRKVIKSFKLDDSSTLAEKSEPYTQALEKIIEPFFTENEYLFEHYLVNFMFQTNFPFSENQNMFDGYLMLVLRYTFIRFYLAGLAAYEGSITKEDVILMIQVYTKTIEHHKTFIGDVLEDIKDKDFDNMDFLLHLL
jgi:lysine-N-methylase